jgi:WD40 repeat protein
MNLWKKTGPDPVRISHQNTISIVVFSPDGKHVLTGSDDHTACLWRVDSGERATLLLTHPDPVIAAAFAPDGRSFVTSCRTRTRRWSAQGEPEAEALEHEDAEAVAVSPDARTLVTLTNGVARLWDVATRKRIGSPLRHRGRVTVVAFARGALLATGSSDGAVRLWRCDTAAEVEGTMRLDGAITRLALCPRGEHLLAAAGRQVRLWNVASGRLIGETTHAADVTALVFAPDGQTALVAGGARAVVWNVQEERPGETALDHPAPVLAASFSPDGRIVATASASGRGQLWDAGAGVALGPPLSVDGAASAIAFAPDGRSLAVAGGGTLRGRAAVWRLP